MTSQLNVTLEHKVEYRAANRRDSKQSSNDLKADALLKNSKNVAEQSHFVLSDYLGDIAHELGMKWNLTIIKQSRE